ncbi:DeoR family transcriptional regulator [uncultured Flavobacterium sp.]|uniref:DeoR family transcriptional regulator n=1 Tax=uncultured Flavobacterium sp. TaxID=165435 RepID=UPI0026237616|nr:DeoR family transcriptional regulator [uncultured Flavobacterium sp.]
MIAENSILVYSDSNELNKYLTEIGLQNKFSIYQIVDSSDILALPGFILFIDSKKINHNIKEILKIVSEENDFSFFKIVIIGFLSKDLFFQIKKNIVFIEVVYSKKQIQELVLKSFKMNLNMSKKETLLKKKIYRIVHFQNLIREKGIIDIYQLCVAYDISKRTLRRDLKIIKELFPEFEFIVNGNWNENSN